MGFRSNGYDTEGCAIIKYDWRSRLWPIWLGTRFVGKRIQAVINCARVLVMTERAEITQQYVASVLSYDADTGKLYWRERDQAMFAGGAYSPARACAAWNAKLAGKEAFTAHSKGYPSGTLLGQRVAAHRLIWLLAYGEIPEFIDHENGDRSDNRLANLRRVSRADNNRNRCISGNNTSGVTGVSWDTHYKKWVAMLKTDTGKKRTHYSASFDDAVAFRARMEAEHGYHPNHGRAKAGAA
ncbi:HNH endonuclease [Sphingomonas aquatilis]|uniref:HNH nuclease domain-containing protein n=1 Tax=Sphingomonas aquatilis TaxID=93063 RepID=A0AAW3TX95_9SPHN|nr:HNH endonuclease [Sphingomonas aquatilis]MBB3876089.1 hypothetical protein [Sphingomonas aquatilis]